MEEDVVAAWVSRGLLPPLDTEIVSYLGVAAVCASWGGGKVIAVIGWHDRVRGPLCLCRSVFVGILSLCLAILILVPHGVGLIRFLFMAAAAAFFFFSDF